MLARSVADPTEESILAAKRVMRYLAGTRDLGLEWVRDPKRDRVTLIGYSDADWAGDTESRRSTTGVVFMVAGAAVVWYSVKQPNVACSSTEAEYIAASEACRDNYWLRILLAEINQAQPASTRLYMDNQTSIRLALEEGNQGRRKHIDVKHHYIRDQVAEEYVLLEWVPTTEQLADILTKPLPARPFTRLRALVMGHHDQE
jgi:ribonuclease HI